MDATLEGLVASVSDDTNARIAAATCRHAIALIAAIRPHDEEGNRLCYSVLERMHDDLTRETLEDATPVIAAVVAWCFTCPESRAAQAGLMDARAHGGALYEALAALHASVEPSHRVGREAFGALSQWVRTRWRKSSSSVLSEWPLTMMVTTLLGL